MKSWHKYPLRRILRSGENDDESKTWMRSGKTRHVYLLMSWKNRGANPCRPSAFSHSCFFSKAVWETSTKVFRRAPAEANSSVYSLSMAVLALIGLQVTPEVRARGLHGPSEAALCYSVRDTIFPAGFIAEKDKKIKNHIWKQQIDTFLHQLK